MTLPYATGDDPAHCELCGKDTSIAMIGRHLIEEHGLDPEDLTEAEIRVIETDERVGAPVMRTRFRWRAEREKRRYEKVRRGFPSYRWEIVREDGRYCVVAMQNLADPSRRWPEDLP